MPSHARTSVRRMAAVTGGTALVAAGLVTVGPAHATAAPPAPTGFKVVRVADNLHDLAISWKPVAGISNYAVRVNNGERDSVLIVPKDQTSLVYHGDGDCTAYRVAVSAVVSKSVMGTTATTWVGPLGPGGISNVTTTRAGDGRSAQITWAAPRHPGRTPVTGFDVKVVNLGTGATVSEARQGGTQISLADLNPANSYVAKVQAVNSYGGCVTHKILVGGDRPTAPKFTVTRDPSNLAYAQVRWPTQHWTGSSPLTGFEVGYKRSSEKDFTWKTTGASATNLTIGPLDPTVNWQVVMRAVAGPKRSLTSKVYTLHRSGYTPNAAEVRISGTEDSLRVDFSEAVGSASNYPKALVQVELANGTNGWSDQHKVTNGAGKVTFDPVPCGTYNVQVTAMGEADSKVVDVVRTRVCPEAPICFSSTLQNGSFETPAIPDRTYRILPTSTAGLGWLNTAENYTELWSNGYSNSSNGSVTAPNGRQLAELNANVAGTLYQDLPTVPGTTMRWHLKHRGRAGADTMRVVIGAPNGTLTQSGPVLTTGNGGWSQYTATYTIPAGQTTTRFGFQAVTTANGSKSVGNFLDDIVFSPEQCQ